MRPHRWQPTRLPHPQNSPGKNTGVGCHFLLQYMKVKSESEVAQSSPTLCNPMDCSPPGSPVPGILQGRTLEWVAISFSNAWKWKLKVKLLSHVRLLKTPWTTAYQAPPSMGFSRQEYWSGVPLPSPTQSIIMLKILQARLQQYVNHELPDVQAGFRKGRGARDQIANICWIIEKAREFQKKSTSALLTMPKTLCGLQLW